MDAGRAGKRSCRVDVYHPPCLDGRDGRASHIDGNGDRPRIPALLPSAVLHASEYLRRIGRFGCGRGRGHHGQRNKRYLQHHLYCGGGFWGYAAGGYASGRFPRWNCFLCWIGDGHHRKRNHHVPRGQHRYGVHGHGAPVAGGAPSPNFRRWSCNGRDLNIKNRHQQCGASRACNCHHIGGARIARRRASFHFRGQRCYGRNVHFGHCPRWPSRNRHHVNGSWAKSRRIRDNHRGNGHFVQHHSGGPHGQLCHRVHVCPGGRGRDGFHRFRYAQLADSRHCHAAVLRSNRGPDHHDIPSRAQLFGFALDRMDQRDRHFRMDGNVLRVGGQLGYQLFVPTVRPERHDIHGRDGHALRPMLPGYPSGASGIPDAAGISYSAIATGQIQLARRPVHFGGKHSYRAIQRHRPVLAFHRLGWFAVLLHPGTVPSVWPAGFHVYRRNGQYDNRHYCRFRGQYAVCVGWRIHPRKQSCGHGGGRFSPWIWVFCLPRFCLRNAEQGQWIPEHGI